jgi:hypothetical protein
MASGGIRRLAAARDLAQKDISTVRDNLCHLADGQAAARDLILSSKPAEVSLQTFK